MSIPALLIMFHFIKSCLLVGIVEVEFDNIVVLVMSCVSLDDVSLSPSTSSLAAFESCMMWYCC